MKIDTGLIVVLAAVLVFYLRLIIIQRERIKRNRREAIAVAQVSKKKGNQQKSTANFSILSKNPLDLVIAGVGMLAIICGMLLYAAVIPLAALQPLWWLPTALGIIAFSWAFKL